MADLVFLDVEEGPNCPLSLQLVFSGLDEARPVRRVRIYGRGDATGVWHDVAAWNTGGEPGAATGVKVEDSGQAFAYLIHGEAEGVRLRPSGSGPWSLDGDGQWGESHLLLTDEADIEWA
jgi:hypothetical protein